MPAPAATIQSPLFSRPHSHGWNPGGRNAISLTDIYHTIEQGHQSNLRQSKQNLIKSAHRRTYNNSRNGGNGRSQKGQNNLYFLSLPGHVATTSRPTTATSGLVNEQYTYAPQADNNDEEDEESFYLHKEDERYGGAQSEPGVSCVTPQSQINGQMDKDYLAVEEYPQKRSVTSFSAPAHYAASRGFCARSRSALLRETNGIVNCLSRQCCDVLGSKICHECAIIKRRHRDTRRYESFLPRVEITEENLATTLLIAKSYPDMPLEEIEMKVAQGEIQKPSFKFNVHRIQERKGKENNEIGETGKRKWKASAPSGATYTFFKSIKDLNKRIVQGQMARKIILTGDPDKDLKLVPKSDTQEKPSFSQMVTSALFTQRKEKEDKQRVVTYYEPPLLAKVCQNVEPSFFAGQEKQYKLPDRVVIADEDVT